MKIKLQLIFISMVNLCVKVKLNEKVVDMAETPWYDIHIIKQSSQVT